MDPNYTSIPSSSGTTRDSATGPTGPPQVQMPPIGASTEEQPPRSLNPAETTDFSYGHPHTGNTVNAGSATMPMYQVPPNMQPGGSLPPFGGTPPPAHRDLPPRDVQSGGQFPVPSMPPHGQTQPSLNVSNISTPKATARPPHSKRPVRPMPSYQPARTTATYGEQALRTQAVPQAGTPPSQAPIPAAQQQYEQAGMPSSVPRSQLQTATGGTAPSPDLRQPQSSIPVGPVGGEGTAPQCRPDSKEGTRSVGKSVPIPQRAEVRRVEPLLMTAGQQLPPPSASDSIAYVDSQNCSPKYVRATLYAAPVSQDLLRSAGLPFGFVVQPLAPRLKAEGEVPVVDYGAEGPLRCRRCHGYINFGVKFQDNGRHWHCNLCGCMNEVPTSQICGLDANGQRKDQMFRPELCHGSVDFVATENFVSKKPDAAKRFLFFIDVSAESVRVGVTHSLCEVIKSMIPIFKNKDFQVGIATYSSSVHFYNLAVEGDPQQLVCSDVEDAFVPHPTGLVVRIDDENASKFSDLLTKIPELFRGAIENRSAVGAAVSFGYEILKGTGGTMVLSTCSLPSHGAGKLDPRFDPAKYSPETEPSLFTHQSKFYSDLGKKCAEEAISVNLLAFPQKMYIDARTVGVLGQLTGGQANLYPLFMKRRDIQKLQKDVYIMLTRDRGTDAIMKMRCSAGFHVEEIIGNFHLSPRSDMEMIIPSIDSEKAFVFILKHDERIKEESKFVSQVAMLYTSATTGRRLIRVHTLTMDATEALGVIFNRADLDAIINVLTKKLLTQVATKQLSKINEELVSSCTKSLLSYRKNCSSSPVTAHLVLPESLKYLPLYVMCLMKSVIFRQNITPSPVIPVDLRTFHIHTIMMLGCRDFNSFVYPKIYKICTNAGSALDDHDGSERNGFIIVPKSVEPAMRHLEPESVLLLDAFTNIYVWFGHEVPEDVIEDLLGIKSLTGVDTSRLILANPSGEGELARKVHGIIKGITLNRPFSPLVRVICEGNQDEFLFRQNLLIEKLPGAPSTYLDFLCTLHKDILDVLVN